MFRGIDNIHWKEALKWLALNSGGSLFPVYVGFFWLYIIGKNPSIIDFSNNGQFAIYTAALLGTAFYIIFKEYKASKFSGRWIFGSTCLIILVVALLLFSAATAAEAKKIEIEIKYLGLIRTFSFLIYSMSLIITFLLVVLDNSRKYKDIQGEMKKGYQDLDRTFTQIGD